MVHNYWLGIMAGAFVIALSLWIGLVFYAERHPAARQPGDFQPRREVIGGEFEAREGGRQLVPHFGQPTDLPESESGRLGEGQQLPVPGQARRTPAAPQAAPAGQPGASLPEQGQAPEHEQAQPQTRADRA
jgi:hypothetical protein